MKKLFLLLLLTALSSPAYAQSDLYVDTSGNVGIGTTSPAASVDASQKTDALALPAGTTSQRPGSPVAGEIRYNSSTPAVEAYVGSAWTSLNGSGGGSFQGLAGQLQCSGGNCDNSTGSGSIQYCPYKGNIKTTASQGNYTIPGACLTATLTSMYVGGTASSSVSASTLYYIYLWNDGGTWVLDAETTGHATDSTSGIEIMSGDDTKTLIGMIQTDASKHVMTGGETNTAGDTNTVATWDNRIPTTTTCSGTGSGVVTATTETEIDSTDRCLFMSWGDAFQFTSQVSALAANGNPINLFVRIYLDAIATIQISHWDHLEWVANGNVPAGPPAAFTPSEGFHSTILAAAVLSGQQADFSLNPTTILTIQ